MIDFDDLDTFDREPAGKPKAVVATLSFECAKCRGTGRFVGYSGRDFGACNLCKGTGKLDRLVTKDDLRKRQDAFRKGKETKEENRRARLVEFQTENAAEYQWLLKKQDRSEFARSLLDGLNQYGSLTDGQLAAVRRSVAKDAEWAAGRAKEREERTVAVDVAPITELLLRAKERGAKPHFLAGDLDISLAPAHGKNPGAVYVKVAGEYAGKILAGKFQPTYTAPKDTLAKLLEITADPKGVAIRHGRVTGNCACCGRTLSDPESIAAGIGPICSAKWGF